MTQGAPQKMPLSSQEVRKQGVTETPEPRHVRGLTTLDPPRYPGPSSAVFVKVQNTWRATQVTPSFYLSEINF